MDLQPMVMERNAARAAFIEYRDSFRRSAQAVDGELMRGYKALADGSALIRLTTTIAAGGVDELGRPRLAFGRADERAIGFRRDRQGGLTFSPETRGNVRAADRRIDLPRGTLPEWPAGSPDDWWGWVADMPLVPPRFRPEGSLSRFHVLWEAVWRRARTRAAIDPALLRHIGGDLYVVLATWDLTPLEQAVLERR